MIVIESDGNIAMELESKLIGLLTKKYLIEAFVDYIFIN
jgi:hypothetical protein